MPRHPDYDVMTGEGFLFKIGAAWAFTDKNENTGYSITLDALPVYQVSEKGKPGTKLVLFKHTPKDAKPAEEDLPF